jgi:hypothetical protein
VLDRAVTYLRQKNTLWAGGREGNFAATVYRFGPYFAISLAEERPAATYENGVLSGFATGRSPFLIYRASDLALVRVLY